MKKKVLAILLTLVMLIGIIPMSALSASADVDEGGSGQGLEMPTPQNVQATLIGFVEATSGKALVVEIEWDALPSDIDGGYKFVEMYPSLKEDENLSLPMSFEAWMGQATLIPVDELTEGGIGYVTKDGRSKLRSVVHILREGDLKVDDNGMACGVKENDKVDIDIYTAGYDPKTQTNGESEHQHVEIVYTEENVKNKKTFTAAVDDKTVAPPAEVVLPYTGQPQACPYTDQAGYYVTLNDPETDAGIYTAVLLLRSGYKWTDGSTEGKPAIWAINKATITSVTLRNTELTYNTQEQHPGIASVMADTLTVPADGYTVSYSETPLYAGKYTLTVKGKGNFTGSASAEFEIFTVTADTCNHVDYYWRYEDNKDGKTHKVFCWNCGGCLNNSESHQIVYDAINNMDGEPIGVYNPRCIHCGYEGDSVFCNHTDELEYTDNGLGTHKVTCKRCKKVVAEKESHTIVTTPIATNVGGVEVYLGQFTYSCEKCDYCAGFTCDHKGTDRIEYTPQNTAYPNYTHIARCAKCLKLLVDDQEACTSDGSWEPSSLTTHTSHCSVCGQLMTGYHDFRGTRKITKFEATPYKGGLFNLFTRYNYRVYYTETCKVCKGVRSGYFDNPMPSSENWADFRSALQSIVNMSPEQLQSYADNDILGYGKHYLMIPANMLSLIYEATGTNEMNYANLDSYFLLNLTNTSDEGSCKMFDKDGKEIASHKPDDNKLIAPSGAGGITASGGEEEGIDESELEMWSFTDGDGAALGVSTDLLMSLEDGEHTLTACFSNENGDRAAVTMLFTIYTADDGQKALKDLHPAGTMINADGDIVSMNLSKDTLIYTGGPLELPAVTLTSETGVEYAEDEDYTLTYYQVVENEDGEYEEVEIAKEDIKDIGTYNVVATPTRNGVLSGEAWAQFMFEKENPTILGDADGDGKVTVLDAATIQKVKASIDVPYSDEAAADVDSDTGVSVLDATWIQKHLASLPSPSGIGKPM
ncbi:MAG: dockerin type I repeat-containing protein [Ruminococcus sp.]|nr:dockerin type I repeat-containing protein [Ruminococcus sp.]